MNTCKDCKWWEANGEDHGCGHRECNCGKVSEERTEIDSINGGSEYYAVTTGPDFGCIHWEAKP